MQNLSLETRVAEQKRKKAAKQRGRGVPRGDESWYADFGIGFGCCHQLQAAI